MNTSSVRRAYDAVAPTYDRIMAGDQWMRHRLWKRYLDAFQPGQHVLDVGCGTGIDALFLAQQGLRVTGVDVSPGMVLQLQAKAARAGLSARVRVLVMDAADLTTWRPRTFDGLISAFASLNTLSPPNMAAFAANAARLLKPGGRAILHMLNRLSLWEWLGLIRHGRWVAARQVGRSSRRTFTVGGQPVEHFLYLPDEAFEQFFAPYFRLRRAEALGVLRPPHTLRRVPPVAVAALSGLERRVSAHRPFLRWGRFFLLDMERR